MQCTAALKILDDMNIEMANSDLYINNKHAAKCLFYVPVLNDFSNKYNENYRQPNQKSHGNTTNQ